MRCTSCGLPLSPTHTPTNCPRCGTPTDGVSVSQQSHYQHQMWETAGVVEAGVTPPAYSPPHQSQSGQMGSRHVYQSGYSPG
ncbi:MAG TPA: hypothetical protein VE843_03565, partial [Ktedonobacteraceae bacterium]|nr:hypothetical protein [Ktedonobacteraceae bacterium]